MIAAAVTMMRRIRRGLLLATSTIWQKRMMRRAMKSSTPLRAACGNPLSSDRPGQEQQDYDRDRRPGPLSAIGRRLGDHGGARRTGVDREGAEQASQEVSDPHADQVATEIGLSIRVGRKARVVAAVWTRMTMAMDKASGAS